MSMIHLVTTHTHIISHRHTHTPQSVPRALRTQLERLQEEIQSIQAQTEDQTRQLQELLEDKTERKIVFSRDPRHRNTQLANEVSVLHFNKDIEYDSD
ncbi:hypothetical protein EON63_06020 [archaeon]|nr:MAG: hypothetical protein EON63_06020 [archaeon]